MTNLHYETAVSLRGRILARTLSSVELCRHLLDRIAAANSRLGAFVAVDRDDVLRQAEAADRRVAAGAETGLLAGLPVVVKDMIATAGLETTCGSRVLRGYVPPRDAYVVRRIREEGGVVLGKTSMDEFGMGSSNEHCAAGPCGNPWHRDFVPGGSSGGSAAAVAAGQAPLALGTDTGGSIRQPASLCGVVGIRPTYGRVSRSGIVAFASSLDQCGPLARTVDDAALLLSVIAGHDPEDSTSVPDAIPLTRPAATLSREGRGDLPLRIGVPKEYFGAGLSRSIDSEVLATINAALRALESLGAVVEEVSLPHTDLAIPAYCLIATAEASSNLARYDGLRYGPRPGPAADSALADFYCRVRSSGFGEEVKRRIILGTFALSAGYYDAYYLKAMKVRTLIRKDFEDAFRKVDLLAAPVSPVAGFRFRECTDDPLTMYLMDILTVPLNLAGMCGMSLPAGFSARGLPIGLQLIAPPFEEGRLVAAGRVFEHAAGLADRHPCEEEIAACRGRRGP